MHKYKIQILICELFIITGVLGFLLYQTVVPLKAHALPGLGGIPVGGFFLPGVFDIYTPIPFCGLSVTVAGPNPGTFILIPGPTVLHRYFPVTPIHIGDNMLGLAFLNPPCPPTLLMLGSSLEPGPGF